MRVTDLGWLAGTWRLEEEGSVWEECWLAGRGASMTAVTRWVRGEATALYELSAIEEEGDDLVLRLRHFGPGLDPWKSEAGGPMSWRLVSASEREVVFEDPKRSFPRRVVYRRTLDDELHARLEGEERVTELRFRAVG